MVSILIFFRVWVVLAPGASVLEYFVSFMSYEGKGGHTRNS